MFINSNTQKVAFNVFQKPTTERTIRQIAKEVKLSPATVAKAIKYLHQKTIVKIRKIAKSHLITGNLGSETYKYYKKIANLLVLEEIVIKIRETQPIAVILFGSFSHAEDIEQSDVDIAVIGGKEMDLKAYEARIGRPLQIFYFASFQKIPQRIQHAIDRGVLLFGARL